MTKKMIPSGSAICARAAHTLRLAVKRARVLLALWPAFSRLNRTSLERQRNNEQDRRSTWTCRDSMRLSHLSLSASALAACVSVIGCTTMGEQIGKSEPVQPQKQSQPEYLQRSKALFAEGKYEAALDENLRALAEGRGAPDAALFNIGLISAYSQNPKKDYPKAVQSFRALGAHHPQSPFAEQGKLWLLILEEHQKMLEEHQKMTEERQRLSDERRAVIREREVLAQERKKLKYTEEKSRQLDLDIEKRRRKSLNR